MPESQALRESPAARRRYSRGTCGSVASEREKKRRCDKSVAQECLCDKNVQRLQELSKTYLRGVTQALRIEGAQGYRYSAWYRAQYICSGFPKRSEARAVQEWPSPNGRGN